jgi:hypothetical protein
MSKSATPKARWLVPGQSILVNGQVLPIHDCQIVLKRREDRFRLTRSLDWDDQVPVVEFWFNQPIQGATAYTPEVKQGKVVLTQVTQPEQVRDWSQVQWLVVISGEAAISVRRLIVQQANRQTPVQTVQSKSTVTKHSPSENSTTVVDANPWRDKLIVKNQPKQQFVDLDVLDFLDDEGMDWLNKNL